MVDGNTYALNKYLDECERNELAYESFLDDLSTEITSIDLDIKPYAVVYNEISEFLEKVTYDDNKHYEKWETVLEDLEEVLSGAYDECITIGNGLDDMDVYEIKDEVNEIISSDFLEAIKRFY